VVDLDENGLDRRLDRVPKPYAVRAKGGPAGHESEKYRLVADVYRL
jgi:hypothetical protein